MGQVLHPCRQLVPWALYFSARPRGRGRVWALFVMPTVWSPTIVALLLIDDGLMVQRASGRRSTPALSTRWDPMACIAAAVPATATATAVFAGLPERSALHTTRGCPLCHRHSVLHRSSRRRTLVGVGSSCHVSVRMEVVPSRQPPSLSLWHAPVLLPRHAAAVGATATVSSSRGLHRSLPDWCSRRAVTDCHDGRSPVGQHHDGAQRCGRLLPYVLGRCAPSTEESLAGHVRLRSSNACDPVRAPATAGATTAGHQLAARPTPPSFVMTDAPGAIGRRRRNSPHGNHRSNLLLDPAIGSGSGRRRFIRPADGEMGLDGQDAGRAYDIHGIARAAGSAGRAETRMSTWSSLVVTCFLGPCRETMAA